MYDPEQLIEQIQETLHRQYESFCRFLDEDENEWKAAGAERLQDDCINSTNLEEMLNLWRGTATFPIGRRALQLYRQLIFGPGFGISVKRRDPSEASEADKKVKLQVAAEYEDTILANLGAWSEDDLAVRTYRDGNTFTYYGEKTGDYLKLRFFDPEEFYDPKARSQSTVDAGYIDSKGIVTDPDDVSSVKYYQRNVSDEKMVPIEADKIVHIKIDCDSTEKWGRSRFHRLYERACQIDEFATVEFKHRRAQASIVLHRKVAGGGKAGAGLILDAAMASYNQNAADLVPVERVPSGTSITTSPNIELEFKHPQGSYSDATGVGSWLIKIWAQVTGFTYEQLSADVSEGNLASATIGETPVAQMIEADRKFFVDRLQPIFKKIVETGIAAGRIKVDGDFWTTYKIEPVFAPPKQRDLLKSAQAYNLLYMAKAISAGQYAKDFGFDPDQQQAMIEEEFGKDFLKPDAQLPGAEDKGASSKSNAKAGGTSQGGPSKGHSDDKGTGKT